MTLRPMLLVDDEPDLRQVLYQGLSKDGYRVEIAANAEEALRILSEKPFDLVLTDLQMPGASGLDLIVSLKAHHPDCLSIVMTGHATLDAAIEAIKLGAYDFIQKPFRIEDLEAVLDRAFESLELKRQMENYQQNLERRMLDRIKELHAFQEEAKMLHGLLHQGFKESNLQKAIAPLLRYFKRSFKPDAYAIICKGAGSTYGYLAMEGKISWPDAGTLLQLQHPALHEESHLCPLTELDPIGWIYVGFETRSAFQTDDPLFELWKNHLHTAIQLMQVPAS